MAKSRDWVGDEDPAILRLHKWGPSQVQLLKNLRDFREGFISPSRELLLLLSYHCEALLLPLVKEHSRNNWDPNNSYSEGLQHPNSVDSCPLEEPTGSRPGLDEMENLQSASEPIGVVNYCSTSETSCLGYDDFDFVSDVHSLAWVLCGESCNQSEETSFRELLFVSGDHGVTAHAFCKSYEPSRVIRTVEEGNKEQGMWAEWGPSIDDSHKMGRPQEDSCLHGEAVREVPHLIRTDAKGGRPCNHSVEANETSAPKRWLRTFMSKVETVTSDGHFYTRFPEKASFPPSARVVSFHIFGYDSPLLDLVSQRDTALHQKESCDPSVPDLECTVSHASSSSTVCDDRVSSNSETSRIRGSNKCFKVFSSSSYCLIGFALKLMDPIPPSNADVPGRKQSKIIVAVARLVSWAIQWVSFVNLDESSDINEWTDFKLSHTFLICLKTSGLISLYDAATGEFAVCLDPLYITGHHCFNSRKPGDSLMEYSPNIIQEKKANFDYTGKRRFRSLVIISHSSLLGVVDEFGVIYVIDVDNHIPREFDFFRRPFPCWQQLGIGLLAGWDVGGAEIGCQKVLHNLSGKKINIGMSRSFSSTVKTQGKEMQMTQESDLKKRRGLCDMYVSCSSGAVQVTDQKESLSPELPSHFMRKIFLPTDRSYEDDVVCFSPFGVTRFLRRCGHYQLVHSNLLVDSAVINDSGCNTSGWEASVMEAIGCTFQGCLYLVTEDGLSVVLPAISISSSFFPVETIGYQQLSSTSEVRSQVNNLLGIDVAMRPWSPWKVEVLDRVLLYEGSKEGDRLCLENGWELRVARIRRLQLALVYLKFEEIENSLEMLACIHLAEEGILRLIFAAVYLLFHKVGNDNEVSAASRLLALATAFAIKMIREYGLSQHKREALDLWGFQHIQKSTFLKVGMDDDELGDTRMSEMARFLQIIRNLQLKLGAKFKRPGHALMDGAKASDITDVDIWGDYSKLPVLSADVSSLDAANPRESLDPSSETELRNAENLALIPADTLNKETSAVVSERSSLGKRVFSMEYPKDMIARWELDNLDLKNIVKDALISGRLPLAVLKLHLLRSKELVSEEETYDTFNEVRGVGRAIAYDLFLKGETALGIETLQKLGEDIETSLKQLLFGTLRRSLRVQIAEEMKIYGYLGPREWKILDRISLIERVYPCRSFQNTFCARLDEMKQVLNGNASEEIKLHVFHPLDGDLIIFCGEVDGVVLGLWANVNGHSVTLESDDDSSHIGYWTAAAVWSDTWDQMTIDRVVLDQPFLIGVHFLWESQFEYHMGHNDWIEVSKLLEVIPPYVVPRGSLSIRIDGLHLDSSVECARENPSYDTYICSIEDLDAVCMNIPNIGISRFSTNNMCSLWLRTLIEDQLAKKFVFLKEYWESTEEIVALLGRSHFILNAHGTSILDESTESSADLVLSITDVTAHPDAILALHKLIVHYCAQHNLPNLLDLYLDQHKLDVDQVSLSLMQDAVRDNQWAKWLIFQRVKGREYEASFCNARTITSHNVVPGNNISHVEIDDIIRTVDDIAEGAGEMAALATLMYAPIPIEQCLSSGSINRNCSSVQCTLENLRPALQPFPTLWRTLQAACFGQDPTCNIFGFKPTVSDYSGLLEYLNWRENIFFSSGRDASLLQMLPCWFPKAVRRLIQLYVEGGPLGWQSLSDLSAEEYFWPKNFNYLASFDNQTDITVLSWEAAIQKHIEEELYASSSEETGLGVEHHLHRGRALAAFNHVLVSRVEKLKQGNTQRGQSGTAVHGQTNVQSDVHALLAPISQSEESLLSAVVPLAIVHFEDSTLVASSAFFLELCGFSSSVLQIDIAALRRISSFYRSGDYKNHSRQLSPRGFTLHTTSLEGGDITESLARALADDYLQSDYVGSIRQRVPRNNITGRPPPRVLMIFLQHLEKASLPSYANGMTCGSWLATGIGDGNQLRSQQKAGSQNWNLVTLFCQMHQLPLSTKYLALLATDNDWVGFLSEAQIGGYPLETVIEVASKEFTNPRLKIHILTVLKSMQSRKIVNSVSNSDTARQQCETSNSDENLFASVELFGIIAECERMKYPGEALLQKAKDLCWSILAMVAACFSDVSPLSCLAVWLEITAARETSAIKVNDVASQIANNVKAAVVATNSLLASARALSFHYNRRNPKRRRLLEPMVANSSVLTESGLSTASRSINFKGIIAEEEREIQATGGVKVSCNSDEVSKSLSRMVAVLCEQHLFLPLLKAFEIFLPSCSLLPFIRALQAISQMRLSEASAHLGSFSARVKEEPPLAQTTIGREGLIGISWISSTAVKAADASLSTCPSPYEKKCFLQLLAATDFGDGGSAAAYYRRLYWKINLAEPLLRKNDGLHLGNETLDDASLLTALIKNACWEQARNWARQLEASGGSWKSAVNHVTEMQAESMVAEWKEYLWDVPEERVALWNHCQTLFIRYSFPASQAGLFFLKHAEAAEKDLPARELHELLLLSLQWLSGMITQSNPVCPLNLLREIETKVWLLAVESESQDQKEGELILSNFSREPGSVKSSNIVDCTANIITKMDNHINTLRIKTLERSDLRENNQVHLKTTPVVDSSFSASTGGSLKTKRRAKGFLPSRRSIHEALDNNNESESVAPPPPSFRDDSHAVEENFQIQASFSRWEESVGPAELEKAILSLLEFGQITAAKQLQNKLSPGHIPSAFVVLDAALKLAAVAAANTVPVSVLDDEVLSIMRSHNLVEDLGVIVPIQVIESLAAILPDGAGRGLCKRVIAVVKAANVLGLSFSEAFDKQPIELLQLLTLKGQDSFEEANLLVQTHSMPAAGIAQVLAESFLKGLLAAHRGGYMDSQKEEGPAPLLWRFSDFLKWAELCSSEPEIGHALMRLVITGQEIPHACEVELLILSHHFYKSSACLDGVDVLVALAATRVEAYVSEGDFPCLARLITGVGNFHTLNFILGILIENGQLDLLLQKYSAAADANTGTAEAVRGFRMAVLTSLQQFNPNDLDAFAMVYNHFDMKHETAALLELRAEQSSHQWSLRYDKDQTEDLLESMRYFIEAAEVHSSIDAGNKTRKACAQASLVSLQIRMPDLKWLNLPETKARRELVEQSRFQEALIVAEAYGLNQPSEWALVLWNQMPKPELTEQFVAEFVAVLPLQPSMLVELARFYKAEVAARGDQSNFSVWLTGGVLPAEWVKYLGRSFRCLLKRTRDLRLRLQLAMAATGFGDVIDACNQALDKVPESAGPLVLRKGHGGAYLPLM